MYAASLSFNWNHFPKKVPVSDVLGEVQVIWCRSLPFLSEFWAVENRRNNSSSVVWGIGVVTSYDQGNLGLDVRDEDFILHYYS